MRLLELYNKLTKSGIGDNPVITDAELSLLNAKLYEVKEFLTQANMTSIGIQHQISIVDHHLDARKLKV